ncbi:hypothetical protein SSX86_024933 [Deinandra increscens subsp. villosa]|uniref:DNA replication checkpoint mediator MRC1 domain-containing protein n=1 Tax=Deinandra increscens subsp. villosa TaxID=3103831 RepID=A0AAP0CIA8_9ASTR
MESDDDYESFSLHNDEPSPSPKHRRLKRLKKSTVQSTTVESVSELIDLPKVDFARLEALEASEIRAFDDSCEPPPSEGLDVDVAGDGKEVSSDFDDTPVDGDRKETKRSLQFDEAFDDGGDGKVKELSNCYDNTRVNSDPKETEEDLEFGEGFNDDETEQRVSPGVDETVLRTDRKETKRALDFDDDVNESGPDQTVKIREDGEKEADEDVMNEKKEKKEKKKRLKTSSDDPKAKTSYSSKRREEKERKDHLDQLHAESQRLLRETRGVSFKPVPLVQKPISSILERIRQRKLEMLKKFPQSNADDSCEEDDHLASVETEVSDLPESVKEEKVSNVLNGDPESVDVGMNEPDACGEQEDDVNACSQKDLDVEPTPALRAPVDDTQELFGDSQTSDDKESDNDESCEQTSSSQEEEMEPSLLTMKLKFDSAPDDICDEEENDKENMDPHSPKHSSPIGDTAKAFLDDEAEEEDDSDNDRMVFGDDDEDENEDDIDELNKMIATGYKERPIDLETRNELHQKWLEEKDAAGTDDLLRRLNVASKLREASLLDDEEGEDDIEMNANNNDDGNGEDDSDDDVEKPRVPRVNSKLAKELIAQMFKDKDDDFFSSDDEETENTLVRERLLNKNKEKSRLVSPIEKKNPGEDLGFIKKLNTVPESRKKPSTTLFFDTMLTGGNSNSSSKSSFLNRMANHSVQISSKQGGSSGAQSFIFGRDDSNSRNSISISEEISNTTTSREVQIKKVTTTYKCSQSQGGSSTQTTKLDSERSSRSFFEILKRSSVQSTVHKRDHDIELSQSVFEAFKIPKKPIKIQGRMNPGNYVIISSSEDESGVVVNTNPNEGLVLGDVPNENQEYLPEIEEQADEEVPIYNEANDVIGIDDEIVPDNPLDEHLQEVQSWMRQT